MPTFNEILLETYQESLSQKQLIQDARNFPFSPVGARIWKIMLDNAEQGRNVFVINFSQHIIGKSFAYIEHRGDMRIFEKFCELNDIVFENISFYEYRIHIKEK